MALLVKNGNPNKVLEGTDFTSQGEVKTLEDNLALVVGCATMAEAFVQNKQYNLRWRESDILFEAPQPFEVYENSYVLAPNVRRFTVAKVVNALVPALYKGLFFEDPPMVLRPRPGTSQQTTDEKTAIMSYFLDACQFKRNVKWGLECMVHLGTGIWKWGVEKKEIEVIKRNSTAVQVQAGVGPPESISASDPPKIVITKKVVNLPFFEFRPLAKVLIDPSLEFSDISEAGWVIDVQYMNFYQLKDMKDANSTDGKADEGWTWGEYYSDEKLKELWVPPVEAFETQGPLRTDVQVQTVGVTHHSEEKTAVTSADPLAKNLEILEYWDRKRRILVVNRKRDIFVGDNKYKKIPFLSSNWWNRSKAFYGMGVGLTVGQNQKVDQGTINSILKILSFAVNPVYLRARDSNSPTQMIRTGIGRILTVDGEAEKAYSLLDNPKVPADTWAALQNSEATTESTTGADAALVQGSSRGPTSGIGRSATGANSLAAASASRMDGPLDNFLDQVFTPFLYILDELVLRYVSDAELHDILGEKMGEDYKADLQKYHDSFSKIEFEVLAGASLAAKRTMQQSLTLITQFMTNPQFNEYLADIGLFIDWEQIFDMWLMASEWKDRQDIIKKMTPEMEQRRAAKMQQQQQGPLQNQMALQSQKADQKAQQAQQQSEDRLQGELTRYAVKTVAEPLETEGQGGSHGFGDVSES